jgi:peptidoglycan hydrolase-like protein with peptidoglycan-binding domain
MSVKTTLSLAAFVIAAFLVAAVSYRVIREEPKPASPKNRTEVTTPPNSSQTARGNPQLIGQDRAPATGSPAPAAGSSQHGAPPTAAPVPTMPAEDRMSAANRRKVQEALHHRGYYQGPLDGIFGPRTRAAIRRFQDSIGAQGTGHLTAVEASRLVSTS